ncbi:hypothetical protein GCM10017714_00970 [Curtobacterium pusillum]|nr:hypothetical protein GCM10017610_16950 [Curtobacterium pusillum]
MRKTRACCDPKIVWKVPAVRNVFGTRTAYSTARASHTPSTANWDPVRTASKRRIVVAAGTVARLMVAVGGTLRFCVSRRRSVRVVIIVPENSFADLGVGVERL